MNKIICDICGTDYPETAAQCPICGCASAGNQTAAGNEAADAEEKAAYTPVKGGRYSKANVRKRLKANQISYDPIPESDSEPEYEDDEAQEEVEEEVEEQSSNRGLIIVVSILLLAIVAVAAYIAVSMFGLGIDQLPFFNKKPTVSQTVPTTVPVTDPITDPTTAVTGIACTELSLSDIDIYLNAVGSVWQLTATPVPADTTDEVIFTSTDENVVTVDASGLVTAVGTGSASITVTCGDVVVDCPVRCGEEGAENTEPTQMPEGFVLKLLTKDFTMKKLGETYKLYDGAVDPADITWTTDNDAVVTIEKGVVTAVSNGRTRVYGEYGDQKVSCWVSVKLPEEQGTDTEEIGAYSIRIDGKKPNFGTELVAEATITIGEEFRLTVVNSEGVRQDVTWKASKEGICSVEGATVIGEGTGNVILKTTIDGQTLKCIIIVK